MASVISSPQPFTAVAFDPFAAVAIGDPWASYEPDLPGINRDCYERLLGLLRQMQITPNLGALVCGDAGSGKTHIIKRFILSDEPYGCVYVNSFPDPAGMRSRLLDVLVADLQNSRSTPQSQELDSQFASQLRLIIDNIAMTIGLTPDVLVPGDAEAQLVSFLTDPSHELEIDLIKSYLKRKVLRTEVERNFVEVIFRFLTDRHQDDAAIYLSGGYLEPEACKRLGIHGKMREPETVEAEEAHSFELLVAFGKLFRFGEPVLVCFDQLENLKTPELRSSFGQLVGDLINQVPHLFPVCFARPEFADEVLQRDMDQAIKERIFANRFQIWGCNKEEARQLILARQEWAQNHAEVDNTLSSADIDVALAKLKLEINAPRKILNTVQHGLSEPEDQIGPVEEISRIYLGELDRLMRAKPRNRKPCRPDALISGLSDYFEANLSLPGSFAVEDIECENACTLSLTIFTPDGRKRSTLVRCDNRNYGPILGKLFYGLSDRLEEAGEDGIVIFLRDGRKEIPEGGSMRFRAKKQFVADGGSYVEFPYRWLAELYALDAIRSAIEARDVTFLTPNGAEELIREQDFRNFIKNSFRSSMADKILHTAQSDQSAIPDPSDIDRQVVRQQIEEFLNQAPFVFPFETIRDHVTGVVRDAPDESILDVLLSAKGRIKQLANNPPTFSLLSNV